MFTKKNQVRPYDEETERQIFDNMFSVVSSTECTGLIQAIPGEEDAAESYSEIYDIPLAEEKAEKTDDNQ